MMFIASRSSWLGKRPYAYVYDLHTYMHPVSLYCQTHPISTNMYPYMNQYSYMQVFGVTAVIQLCQQLNQQA